MVNSAPKVIGLVDLHEYYVQVSLPLRQLWAR